MLFGLNLFIPPLSRSRSSSPASFRPSAARRRSPTSTAPRTTFAATPRTARLSSICTIVATRAPVVTGAMSPKPTVESTVTAKYSAPVRSSRWVKLAGSVPSSSTYVAANTTSSNGMPTASDPIACRCHPGTTSATATTPSRFPISTCADAGKRDRQPDCGGWIATQSRTFRDLESGFVPHPPDALLGGLGQLLRRAAGTLGQPYDHH
jgi:hypothetical protein